MNRIVLLFLAVVAASAALGLAIAKSPGYVLIAYEGFRFEASLWATLVLIAAACGLVYGLKWLLTLLLRSGGLINPWSDLHRSRRARLAADKGVLELQEGRWAPARRHLQQAAERADQPLMYYLGAARAAQQLGQTDKADQLLERALDNQPKAELAVALAHAELQRERGEQSAALETLNVMRERFPGNPQVLLQLLGLYRTMADYSALLGLLPELRKGRVIPAEEFSALELETWNGRLRTAGQQVQSTPEKNPEPLQEAWQQMSASLRREPELLLTYAGELQRAGVDQEAEDLLCKAIKQQYDPRMISLYGLVRAKEPHKQLATAESWLPAHPNDPVLLRCLGRICLRCALWGKARDYFEASLTLQPDAETCMELARLLSRMGDTERSNQLFQQGVALQQEGLPALPSC